MPNNSTIEWRVYDLIGRYSIRETVAADEVLGSDLAFDSLDVVELAMDLEREFNFDIPDADSVKWCDGTVRDVVNYVRSRNV